MCRSTSKGWCARLQARESRLAFTHHVSSFLWTWQATGTVCILFLAIYSSICLGRWYFVFCGLYISISDGRDASECEGRVLWTTLLITPTLRMSPCDESQSSTDCPHRSTFKDKFLFDTPSRFGHNAFRELEEWPSSWAKTFQSEYVIQHVVQFLNWRAVILCILRATCL